MRDLLRDFFANNPGAELWAMGSRIHKPQLNLAPFGVAVKHVDPTDYPSVVQAYFSFNRNAFSGDLTLPGWVLADLYLLPGVVGLLVAPVASFTSKWQLETFDGGKGIVAAYCAVPSMTPGLFVGVSLISGVRGMRAGPMIKALTLEMNGAKRLVGVSGWDQAAIRAHATVGPLRIVSAAPGPHERAASSFVYETTVEDHKRLRRGLAGELDIAVTERVSIGDQTTLNQVLHRVAAGETIIIVPPGVDDEGCVCLAVAS